MKSDQYMGPKVENFVNCRGIEAVFRFTGAIVYITIKAKFGKEESTQWVNYLTRNLVLISKEGE